MICYLITAGVVALGLLATWTSGRDVGYRNAMRRWQNAMAVDGFSK